MTVLEINKTKRVIIIQDEDIISKEIIMAEKNLFLVIVFGEEAQN